MALHPEYTLESSQELIENTGSLLRPITSDTWRARVPWGAGKVDSHCPAQSRGKLQPPPPEGGLKVSLQKQQLYSFGAHLSCDRGEAF